MDSGVILMIQRILASKTPLTLSGAPAGFLPWLMTDLARGATPRAVFIAADDQAMRAMAETAHYFAPELEVLTFPAWDCLPYDRASPSLRSTSERMACLAALQRTPDKPQLVVTTINAATQRTLTPFRIRQLSARLVAGERIDRDRLAALLQANGYVRSDTVADAGEYAVRGSLVDLFPSGEPHGLRLDFFGDEIESVRSFDPADQRSIAKVDGFTLLPASEALLDEDGIKRFRSRYRDHFGATATGDPLYQAISEGRRLAGMDHWLPLIEEKLATFFDHIGSDALIVRDAGSTGAGPWSGWVGGAVVDRVVVCTICVGGVDLYCGVRAWLDYGDGAGWNGRESSGVVVAESGAAGLSCASGSGESWQRGCWIYDDVSNRLRRPAFLT